MGFLDVFRILILPALVAAALYVLGAYVILPLYRAHHARYAQYIPLDAISQRTSGFRTRLQHSVSRFLMPRYMHWRHDMSTEQEDWDGSRSSQSSGGDADLFPEEEGERMIGFDVGRRERLPVRRAGGFVEGEVEIDTQRRLSRELEEGFKDESESESDGGDDRRR
ncbi:hypothetical protein LTR37_016681 [Vermiconidia calcicola]|uniref:Uncharacterized protein n=1 Tax=Vermiconidia calcicola TaxID=1690605 RepID=A0ACC3MNR0_9PEZI|nr:hypothetical protein LTR37_016681 [Vermiconidia calcicola]